MARMMHAEASGESQKTGKRVFGWFEAAFDGLYLCTALVIGVYMLSGATRQVQVLAGAMALVLAVGDAFHLVPRIIVAVAGAKKPLAKALSFGKIVTSITMTIFYVLLWHIGILLFSPAAASAWTAVVYLLAILRIALCLFKQNRWFDQAPPVSWALYRNIPFMLLGAAAAALFGLHAHMVPGFRWMGLAIVLSFAFYMPVVLGANKNRMLGMLMFPKTCAYLWMLFMCVKSLT